jgi:hypothetical protein
MDQSLLRMKKHRGFVKPSGCVAEQLNKQKARAWVLRIERSKNLPPARYDAGQ